MLVSIKYLVYDLKSYSSWLMKIFFSYGASTVTSGSELTKLFVSKYQYSLTCIIIITSFDHFDLLEGSAAFRMTYHTSGGLQ